MKVLTFTLIVLAVLSSIESTVCLADSETDLESKVANMMDKCRNQQPLGGLSNQQLKTVDPNYLLRVLEPYQNDQTWTVRRLTYWYEFRLAQAQPIRKVRQEVVQRLVKASITSSVKQVNKWLLTFMEQDFTQDVKEMIRQSLQRDKVNRWHILICGVARIDDQLPILEKMLIDEMEYQAKVEKQRVGKKWYYTTGWSARLARARMGVKEDINKCLQLVETVENLDRRVITLLRDVGYTRQPEAIEFLQRYLESQQRLSPVKPTAPGQPVASYVLDILIDCLKDFPIERKPGRGYKWKQIEQAREWMKEQKKWDIIR